MLQNDLTPDPTAQLPHAALSRSPDTPLSAALAANGHATFRDVCAWLWRLPYRRVAHPRDILTEGCGTCSSKHALAAMVARELGLGDAVALVLAFYMMDQTNTPGVGPTLERWGLRAIPEAHCVLRCGDRWVDITRHTAAPVPPSAFVATEVVSPERLARDKVALHRAFMAQWIERGGPPDTTLDALWSVRESCIAALSGDS